MKYINTKKKSKETKKIDNIINTRVPVFSLKKKDCE